MEKENEMFYITEIQQMALDTGHLWINNNWVSVFLFIETIALLGLTGYYLWNWVDDDTKIDFGTKIACYFFGSFFTAVVGLVTYVIAQILIEAWVRTPVWGLLSIVSFVILMFVARYGRRTHKLLHKHVKDKDAHK